MHAVSFLERIFFFIHVPHFLVVAPSFTKLPEDTTSETGGLALLDCEADGMPTPAITWNTPLPELGKKNIRT